MLSITSAGRETSCAFCGNPIVMEAADSRICQYCTEGLAGRRIAAFLIDLAIWSVMNVVVSVLVFVLQPPEILTLLIDWPMRFLFLVKDGISGYSPGKYLLGLRVIDMATGSPGDYIDSVRRNIPFLFPLLGFVMLFQLPKGRRWGDGWAHTQVVRASREAGSRG